MRGIRVLVTILLAASLAGCISSTTTITVKGDGSGTIDTITTMSAAVVAQMKEMMAGLGGKEGKQSDPFSTEEMKAAAAKMGEGVTFVKSEPIKRADAEGVHAVYAFKDVSKLYLNQTPDSLNSAAAGMGQAPAEPAAAANAIRFRFAKQPNGNVVLTMVMPKPKPKPDEPAAPPVAPLPMGGPEQAQALEMVKMLFKDMRIEIGVNVDGRLVTTNSPYVTGNHVTLLEMDFGQLMSDPTRLAQLQNLKSLEDAKVALKDVKGIKLTTDPEVRIEFAPR